MSVVEKSFYKGEVIVKEGDIGDSFFRLLEGKASVYADWDKKDQEPFRIALLETGEYFGEMAISFPFSIHSVFGSGFSSCFACMAAAVATASAVTINLFIIVLPFISCSCILITV